jgi:hypothetical protein
MQQRVGELAVTLEADRARWGQPVTVAAGSCVNVTRVPGLLALRWDRGIEGRVGVFMAPPVPDLRRVTAPF